MKLFIAFILFILIVAAIFLLGPKSPERTPVSLTSTGKKSEVVEKEIFETEGVKHSIALEEVFGGGPRKDDIPSIDEPSYLSPEEVGDFLEDSDVGIGVVREEKARFYPYKILVRHEIVNDILEDIPLLVSYCPLCGTAIIFERRIDGEAVNFGVSGLLWQSNLLMYNRIPEDDVKNWTDGVGISRATPFSGNESLWSQVLGEAVVGEHTGKKLTIIPSNITRYGEWKKAHPETDVLRREVGLPGFYIDPYEAQGYYESKTIWRDTNFDGDDRLHPKALVIGIEIDGVFKAYEKDALAVGDFTDDVHGQTVVITRTPFGEITIKNGEKQVVFVEAFWFSWKAVHTETELYYKGSQ